MQIHGLEPAIGETAFAFCVLRLRQATARSALLELIESLAPLIPDAESVMEELLPEDLEQAVRIIAVPWQPPEGDLDLVTHREVIASAAEHGVEEVWFFQTGTALPPVDDDGDDEDADLAWSNGPPPQVERTRFPVDGTENPDTADFGIAVKLAGEILPGEGTVLLGFHTLWLAPYGGRYRNASVTIDRTHHAAHFWVDRFEAPCDAEELVGHLLWIVSKLDEVTPVVHARIAEATLTQKYGELMGEEEEPFVLGGNPLMAAYALGGEAEVDEWIANQRAWSKEEVAQMLREVAVEIVTADDEEPDADEIEDEEAELDNDEPADEELADEDLDAGARRRATRMSAVDIDDADAGVEESAMPHDDIDVAADIDDEGPRRARQMSAVAIDDDDADEQAAPSAHAPATSNKLAVALRDATGDRPRAKGTRPIDAAAADDDDDDDVYEDDVELGDHHDVTDRGRALTTYAVDILRERAALGRLDPRGAERLLPLLTAASRFEGRRHAAIDILGAARSHAAVGPLVEIARTTKPDAPGKTELLAAVVTALGSIGDAAAVPVLADLVAAEGASYDASRAAAADALIACSTASVDARLVDALLVAIRDRGNTETLPPMLFATGRLARLASGDDSARAKQALADLDLTGEDPIALLAREGALVMLGDSPSRDLTVLLHECLTTIDYDHETTARKLRIALHVAELVPYVVDAADLTWLTSFVEADIRGRAHALLVRLGKPIKRAAIYDRYSVRALGDDDVIDLIGEARVVGRAAVIAEAARRKLVRAKAAIIDACHDVVSRARHGAQNLLDPETRILEAAVPFLRRHLDAQVISLFDRMLRHPNYHVKWELLQEPPIDERLIAGMFHVLGERWGWQEETAKVWLANFQGTPEYELERRRVPTPPPYVPDDQNETNDDDQDMN